MQNLSMPQKPGTSLSFLQVHSLVILVLPWSPSLFSDQRSGNVIASASLDSNGCINIIESSYLPSVKIECNVTVYICTDTFTWIRIDGWVMTHYYLILHGLYSITHHHKQLITIYHFIYMSHLARNDIADKSTPNIDSTNGTECHKVRPG